MYYMKRIFENYWMQKLIYSVGLLILVIISFKDGSEMLNQQSSLGIPYWYFFVIPCTILIIQILFNSVYGWYSIFILYVLYFIWFIVSMLEEIKYKSENIVRNHYLILTIIILMLLSFGYFLYLIKPRDKK